VTVDSSMWSYFADAGLVVKAVMLLLISASVVSWTFILQRAFYLRGIKKDTRRFESKFWAGGDLFELYDISMKTRPDPTGLDAIYQSGFKEFTRMRKNPCATSDSIMESTQRAMRAQQMREQDKLEMHLPLLATVGSTSPYVGLFGTVWGIMLSFKALASVQQATVSMVAPGIAEALIATAMGLFAAIPAVVAYNRYATEIGRLLNRFDAFQDELANILARQNKLTSEKEA